MQLPNLENFTQIGKPDEKPKSIIDHWEGAIEELPRRTYDTYILGPFLIWYGIKSKKMPKTARRLVVTAGIYQIWYSWKAYRELPTTISKVITGKENEPVA